MTTRQGHPIHDNQSVRTIGERGPTTLENYQFLEKITHFDRERVPERVVHVRGAGAHGVFEAYGTIGDEAASKYTRARLFQEKGIQTPVFVRFSSVIHGGHSPETLRDPRGFAVKFYTQDGNWDLVGNNLKIFFIRDPLKFSDMVHAFKPDPVTNVLGGGLVEAPRGDNLPHEPYVEGRLVRRKISRTDDFAQAGQRYRDIEQWERDDLVMNLVNNLKMCKRDIQERMVSYFAPADEEYGRRIAQGIGLNVGEVMANKRLRID